MKQEGNKKKAETNQETKMKQERINPEARKKPQVEGNKNNEASRKKQYGNKT